MIKSPNIPPIEKDQAREIWHALFAVLHAVEQLGLQESVNSFVHEATKCGAYDFGLRMLESSVIDRWCCQTEDGMNWFAARATQEDIDTGFDMSREEAEIRARDKNQIVADFVTAG